MPIVFINLLFAMKKVIGISVCLIAFWVAAGAQRSTADFYRMHKREQGVRNAKIPGWLVWMSTGVAHEIVKEEQTKAILRLARKVKTTRLLMAETHNPIPTVAVSNLMQDTRHGGYDDLLMVQQGNKITSIMGKVKKDKFRRLLVVVHSDDEFVFFEMKSNIRIKDITEITDLFARKTPLLPAKTTPKANTPKV